MKKESIKKSRMTNQRRVVYEELKKLTSHPTADELYRVVKKRIPKISLGTVYRNLNLLVKTGVIRRLYFSDSIYRFDANTKKHHHIRCIQCGRVDDIFNFPEKGLEKMASNLTKYKVLRYKLDFFGVCPKCIKSSKKAYKLKNT